MSKDSLNKYKKKVEIKGRPENYKKQSNQRTSKNQFQKYFLDAVNVFYQDRETLKLLEQTKLKIKIFLPLWFLLALLYLFVSRIQPFEGVCPENATCKVFIRCNPGYQLTSDGKHCQVKASIIEQIENVCKFEIESLKHEYGDAECLQNVTITAPPYKQVRELVDSITKSLDERLSHEIDRRIHSFLNNETNQLRYDFSFENGKVIPLVKKYSFSCWLSISSKTTEFKVTLVVVVLVSILSGWLYVIYTREQKVKQIYEYLKGKVLEENKVNITLLNDEMKSLFGNLDENIWIKIDEERKKDGRIGYFEDEFLFWKLL